MSRVARALAPIQRMVNVQKSGLLRKQSPKSCVLDHAAVVKAASGLAKDISWKTVSMGMPTAIQVKTALQQGPCLFIAKNIAQSGSNYVGHHAVALIRMEDEQNVLVVDRDDTVSASKFSYVIPLAKLLENARLPTEMVDSQDELSHEEQLEPVLQTVEESSSWCTIM